MSALLAQKRKALIPYVTAGFPFADITPALMHGMVAGATMTHGHWQSRCQPKPR